LDSLSQNRDVVISSFGLVILVARIKLKTKDRGYSEKLLEHIENLGNSLRTLWEYIENN
jgi:hypothetical protein